MKNRWMARSKAGLILLLCLLVLCLAAGCGPGAQGEQAVDFYSLERQTYESDNGYDIQLPADWVLLAEDEESVTFASPSGDQSCMVSCELGGVEYYSLEEVGQMLVEKIAAGVFAEWEALDPQITEATYYRQISGTTGDQTALTADIHVYQAYEGIRYYMVFLTDSSVYGSQGPLVDGILGSFQTTMHQEELYALMMERREAAAGAETPGEPGQEQEGQAQDGEAPTEPEE